MYSVRKQQWRDSNSAKDKLQHTSFAAQPRNCLLSVQTCRSHHEDYSAVESWVCHWRCLYPSLQPEAKKKRTSETANRMQAPSPRLCRWQRRSLTTQGSSRCRPVHSHSTEHRSAHKRLEAADHAFLKRQVSRLSYSSWKHQTISASHREASLWELVCTCCQSHPEMFASH